MHSDLIEHAADVSMHPAPHRRALDYPLPGKLSRCEQALLRCSRAAAAEGDSPSLKAEWILDNCAFIQTQIREIREALPRAYYRLLPCIAAGEHAGETRAYALAMNALRECGAPLRIEALQDVFNTVQRTARLLLGELWAIGPMLKLVAVERICAAALDPDQDDSAIAGPLSVLRTLESASWPEFIESISEVHRILQRDPAGVYATMEFSTRDAYRHAIEGIARRTHFSESDVAELAVALAQEGASAQGHDSVHAHVGYYLSGPGLKEVRAHTGYRRRIPEALRELVYALSTPLHIASFSFITAALVGAAWAVFAPLPWWLVLLLIIPASHAASAITNTLVNLAIPPRTLPRLDFSDGIPGDCKTFVAVPTLLLSKAGVEKLLERLEIHYLANRDPNLYFALLTDFPDAPAPDSGDPALLKLCADGIRSLNQRYGSPGVRPFYLFHRQHTWNASEGAWMGRERKRGKLVGFNRLLLGLDDAFATKVGDLSVLREIRYVITLDSDTRLPLDTARKMIGTLAHPLNRPVIDPKTNTVREGYAILQPRISISMESSAKSRLARIYSGQTGFDPYTTAVSDVYQDLHGRAIFTGKGIYDLRAFEAVAGNRFPENSLLSHDLLEGEYARTGLITDLELVDDYPATYEAYSKRKHRWVRGDWQTVLWLALRVPHANGGAEPNPLPAISRFKIADNLRRSLLEPAMASLLVAGWFALPGRSALWTLLALALLTLPAYGGLLTALLRLPPRRFWRVHFREAGSNFAQAHVDAALSAVFLIHQAALMTDAIVRTLIRRFVTRRRLLEWESMAQAEELTVRRMSLAQRYLFAAPVIALAVLCAIPAAAANAVTCAIVIAWAVSPFLANWLSRPSVMKHALTASDIDFLRDTALRTWRYFADLARPEYNGLAPDNVQERPSVVATRTSPTNIGLQLAATIAAHDFGYIGRIRVIEMQGTALNSIGNMQRYRGHLFNWYDTITLAPLAPRYVSTVDSGNLAASLIAAKQGCLEMLDEPVIGIRVLSGLRDYSKRLWNTIPRAGRASSVTRLFITLFEYVEHEPADLFHYENVLDGVEEIAGKLQEHLDWVTAKLDGPEANEIRYWYASLLGRVRSAQEELRRFAPWLAEPFEPELRPASADASLAPLFAELERISPVTGLPQQYDAIAVLIRQRLASPEPLSSSLRKTLLLLSAELPPARENARSLMKSLADCAARADACAKEMDFAFLFDHKRKLLRIGYDADGDRLDSSCYDLLASEARTAVFFAIAKGDIPREAWFRLGRKLVSFGSIRTLRSWGGTMFEYLMPNLFMSVFDGTLLGESVRSVVKVQQAWAGERGLPWGVSEAAFNAWDGSLSYRYQTFGIPEISMQRKDAADVVIAPYASMLALLSHPASAVANLRDMELKGWTGKYGFVESIDHTPGRTPAGLRCAVVRAFMVHHQAMGFLAICNTVLENAMQWRFHADPLVKATDFLLQERVPLTFTAAEPAWFAVPAAQAEVASGAGERAAAG